MSAPDKCPYCGAVANFGNSVFWNCGVLRDSLRPIRTPKCYEFELNRERAALDETRKELEMEKQNFNAIKKQLDEMHVRAEKAEARVRELEDQNSASYQSVNLYKSRLEHAEAANEMLRKQITETERALQDAKADASSWQAQSERFEKQFLEAAERVGELEGLEVINFVRKHVTVQVPNPLNRIPRTLGEAMPRREGV